MLVASMTRSRWDLLCGSAATARAHPVGNAQSTQCFHVTSSIAGRQQAYAHTKIVIFQLLGQVNPSQVALVCRTQQALRHDEHRSRHLSRREILRVNSGGVARCDGAPGPISKHTSA